MRGDLKAIAFFGVLGALVANGASWAAALPFVVLALVAATFQVFFRTPSRFWALLEETRQHILKGAFDDAERCASEAATLRASRSQKAYLVYLESETALDRGDLAAANRRATEVLQSTNGDSTMDTTTRGGALACRALARVGLGDLVGAAEDAAACEAIDGSAPTSVARARVVTALVATREGRIKDATALLARDEALFARVDRRTQLLARALARFGRTQLAHAYREPHARGDAAVGSHAQWIQLFAPLAGFIDARALASSTEPPIDAKTKPAASRVSPWYGILMIYWVISIVGLGGLEIAHRLDPDVPTALFVAQAAWSVSAIAWVVVLVVARPFATIPFAKRDSRQLLVARRRAIVDGDTVALEGLASSRFGEIAGHANLVLAAIAVEKGDFERAVSIATKGLERRTNAEDAAALVTEATVARVALGQFDVRRDLDGLKYSQHEKLRVELVLAARQGDIETAARCAAMRSLHRPYPWREDWSPTSQ